MTQKANISEIGKTKPRDLDLNSLVFAQAIKEIKIISNDYFYGCIAKIVLVVSPGKEKWMIFIFLKV